MKTLIIIASMFICESALAQNVYVDGYTRSDGTYVAPHVRSAPDAYKWNNYGDPAPGNNLQEQQVEMRDYDTDGIYNQYDYDDDNDGISDEYEE